MTQGQLDLERGYLLYERRDFGFSAYCAQQALEKYLKAYLLRHQVLSVEPYELGHMCMNKLLREVTAATDKVLLKFGRNNNRFQTSSNAGRKQMEELGRILSSIQSYTLREDKRIKPKEELWSVSIGLPVDTHFDKYLTTTRTRIVEGMNPVLSKFMLFYEIELRSRFQKYSKESKQRALDKYVSDHGHYGEAISKVMHGEAPNLDKLEVIQYAIAILEYLEHLMTYELKKLPEIREQLKLSKEVFILMYPFKFLDLILSLHPHEDIGRYPTQIHDKSSLELYEKQKDEIMKLLEATKAASQRIQNAVQRNWEMA